MFILETVICISYGVMYDAFVWIELISKPLRKTKAAVKSRLLLVYGTKADKAFPDRQADKEPVSI